jgi:hypothetical protein
LKTWLNSVAAGVWPAEYEATDTVATTETAHVWSSSAELSHLIKGGVMLREAKHLWLFPVGGSLQKRSEILLPRLRDQNDSYMAFGSKPNEEK